MKKRIVANPPKQIARTMPSRLRKHLQKNVAKSIERREGLKSSILNSRIIANELFRIDIVYFANLFVNPQHGTRLIREQMTDLIATGLTRISHIHIVLSVPPDFDFPSFQTILGSLFHGQQKSFHVYIEHENCHEYPGIQLVQSLAFSNGSPHHYLLYFHSKGISRFRGRRETHELALHKTVIAPWRHVLEIFDSHPHIDKIGSTSSDKGWIWWNYWWARSSYLIQVEIPIKTERRHYYEDWLGRTLVDIRIRATDVNRPENGFDCGLYHTHALNCWSLSVNEQPTGKACSPAEALHFLLR